MKGNVKIVKPVKIAEPANSAEPAVEDITPKAAFSSSDCPRYQDLTRSFLRRTAKAMTDGHIKHELNQLASGALEPYEKNYLLASTSDALDRLGHVMKHLADLNCYYLYRLNSIGRNSPGIPHYELPADFEFEDHLGHAAAGLNMLAGMEDARILPSSEIA